MAVDFRVVPFTIEGDDDETRTEEARFDSDVNRAAVAIQSFRLDMQPPGASPEMNIVQVAASASPPVQNEVNVKLSTHFSGRARGVEYKAEVRVLVIADVKLEPTS
jgi:hypothetical protein